MICDVCCKPGGTTKLTIVFQNGSPCYINVCHICKELAKNFFINMCDTCGAFELWSKHFFAPIMKMPLDDDVRVIVTGECLNCRPKKQFFRG